MNCAAEPAQRNSELKQLIPTETKKIRQAETGLMAPATDVVILFYIHHDEGHLSHNTLYINMHAVPSTSLRPQ